MNRRDFGKQVATFGLGAGAMLVAPSAHAGMLPPSWLVRLFYNQRMFGLIEYGNINSRTVSLTLPVPQNRMDMYRSILPRQLDVPDIPLIQIYAVELRGAFPAPDPGGVGYEVGVNIRATFKGDRKTDPKTGGWHSLTLPVTSDGALQGGLMMGYPKYKAKIISDVSLDQAHVSTDARSGKRVEQLGLNWQSGNQVDPYADLQNVPTYVIRDRLVNIMESKDKRRDTYETRSGPASAFIRTGGPLADLTNGMDLRGIGSVEVKTGRFVLTRRSW